MTLRLQFDDMVRQVEHIHEINVAEEDEFLQCALNAMALKDKFDMLQEERKTLEKVLAEEEKDLATLKSKLDVERMKLEEEQRKSSTVEKERDALDKILSEARKVILGSHNSSSQVMSLLESISTLSDQ